MSGISVGRQAIPGMQPMAAPAATPNNPQALMGQIQALMQDPRLQAAGINLNGLMGGGAAAPVAGAPGAAAGAAVANMQGQPAPLAPSTARLLQELGTQETVRRNTSTLSGGISTLIETVGKQQTRVSRVSAALAEDAAAQGAMNPAALARLNQESTTASHLSEQARKLQRDLEQSISTWLRQ